MSFEYIKSHYGRSFEKGQRVHALGKPGKVSHASHYVHVQLDGMKHNTPYHPTDVEPAEAQTNDR